jgi:hypothetical protein
LSLWICIRGHHQPKGAVFRQFKFETKSSIISMSMGIL